MHLLSDLEQAQAYLLTIPQVKGIFTAQELDIPINALRIDFLGDDAALGELLAGMVMAGIRPITFSEKSGDLEDVFLQVTKGIIN